jgi:hypothetical protein
MDRYRIVIAPSARETRLLVQCETDDLLRARLPPPSWVRHERAAATFLEGVALWLDRSLPVVLSVADEESTSCLGLTDELGTGARSLFFRTTVVSPGPHRRRARLGGVADFRDLRHLAFVADGGE